MAKKSAAKTSEASDAAAAPEVVSQASIDARLRAMRASINKEFGANSLMNLAKTDTTVRFPYQIPSGSIGLDIALGPIRKLPDGRWQTGFAPGRMLEIFGPEGSGKSTLCMQLMANAQAMGMLGGYVDMEHALDMKYAQQLGMNLVKTEFTQPNSGEDALNITKTLVSSGLMGLVVVDSVATLVPESELKGEIGDSSMGSLARLMSQSCRIMNGDLISSNSLLVWVNQIREKIGVFYGNPETTPGGRALRFYASYRIDIRRKETLKNGDTPYGHTVEFTVIKNKVATPFRKARVDLIYGYGFNSHLELVDLCLGRNILTSNGAWVMYGDRAVGQGRFNAAATVREDRILAYTLYDALMTTVNAERGLHPDGSPIVGFKSDMPESAPTVVSAFTPLSKEEITHIQEMEREDEKVMNETT